VKAARAELTPKAIVSSKIKHVCEYFSAWVIQFIGKSGRSILVTASTCIFFARGLSPTLAVGFDLLANSARSSVRMDGLL
jgi:hypothetical protein